MGIALAFVLINGLAAGPLFRLMTSDEAVVDACGHFVIWLVLMPLLGCPAFTWDGIFLGATASRPMRNSSLWSVLAFFAVWLAGYFFNLASFAAIHLLLAAYLAHLAARTIHLTLTARKVML